MWLGITLLALIGAIAWFARRPRHHASPDDRDVETLAEAEREVRDLDAFASPEDAEDELHDWGPGAPRE
jgi:hypothetical protein